MRSKRMPQVFHQRAVVGNIFLQEVNTVAGTWRFNSQRSGKARFREKLKLLADVENTCSQRGDLHVNIRREKRGLCMGLRVSRLEV